MAVRDATAQVEADNQKLMKEGKLIQMHHPGKGIRYVTNTEQAIGWARKRGYCDVEYTEEVVKTPRAVPVGQGGNDKPKPLTIAELKKAAEAMTVEDLYAALETEDRKGAVEVLEAAINAREA